MRKLLLTTAAAIGGVGVVCTAFAFATDVEQQVPNEDEELINEVMDNMECDMPEPVVVEGTDGQTHVIGCVTLERPSWTDLLNPIGK